MEKKHVDAMKRVPRRSDRFSKGRKKRMAVGKKREKEPKERERFISWSFGSRIQYTECSHREKLSQCPFHDMSLSPSCRPCLSASLELHLLPSFRLLKTGIHSLTEFQSPEENEMHAGFRCLFCSLCVCVCSLYVCPFVVSYCVPSFLLLCFYPVYCFVGN